MSAATPKATEFDIVIRGGTVYDGTGVDGFRADVAVLAGMIVEVGSVQGLGREEIDATGRIVTPGFVDLHTHYDGQVIWSDQLTSTSWHGVTTVLVGNCGVGFAPCRRENRDGLIALMEGVEDIPAPVMTEGLTWDWETFPDYLNALDRTHRDIDVCALLPHAPLRVYVMGERAFRLQPALPDDIDRMREIVSEAIAAGAFGVSTSRATAHQSSAGEYTPTLLARERELVGLVLGMQDAGGGIFQVVNESMDPEVLSEYQMIRRIVERSGCPSIFSLAQSGTNTTLWREVMAFADDAIADGVPMRPMVAPRSIGMLMGLEPSQHPLRGTATYQSIQHLPLAERVERMRDPAFRQSMLSDDPMEFNTWQFLPRIPYSNMFRLGSPPNYTPRREESLESIAKAEGRSPQEVLYDVLIENDGLGMIYVPFSNYATGDLSVSGEMLANPNTVMGLSDGGAHLGFIIDAGFPTWLLTYWVRDQGLLSLPEGIRRLTSDTAGIIGLTDRGRIATGLRADINIIDFDRLQSLAPEVSYDLPEGGKRLVQRSTGYDVTMVAGEVTYRAGQDTGARPGRLVRARQPVGTSA